jgi:hypothetical protein
MDITKELSCEQIDAAISEQRRLVDALRQLVDQTMGDTDFALTLRDGAIDRYDTARRAGAAADTLAMLERTKEITKHQVEDAFAKRDKAYNDYMKARADLDALLEAKTRCNPKRKHSAAGALLVAAGVSIAFLAVLLLNAHPQHGTHHEDAVSSRPTTTTTVRAETMAPSGPAAAPAPPAKQQPKSQSKEHKQVPKAAPTTVPAPRSTPTTVAAPQPASSGGTTYENNKGYTEYDYYEAYDYEDGDYYEGDDEPTYDEHYDNGESSDDGYYEDQPGE